MPSPRCWGACRERRRGIGGRGPRSTSTPSPTTSACCAGGRAGGCLGRGEGRRRTGTAPSPSARPRSTPVRRAVRRPRRTRAWPSRRAGIDGADPGAQRAAARARRGDRRPRADADRARTLEAIDAAGARSAVGPAVHLKVDTGMHRVGAAPSDVAGARRAASPPPLRRCGCAACSPTSPSPTRSTTRYTADQLEAFDDGARRAGRRTCRTRSSCTPPTRPAPWPIRLPGARSCAPASPCTASRRVPASTTSRPSCARCCRCGPGCRS